MTGMKTLSCGIWILLVAAAPAFADGPTAAPSSLRMRAAAQTGTHWAPGYWRKRVAQAAPDPAPAADAAPAEPAPAPGSDAAPAPAAAPAANVESTPAMTDDELKAIAEAAEKE